MRAIAVVGAKPFDHAAGYCRPRSSRAIPGMSADNWYAIVVPAGTPQPIVDKLHAAILQATNAPEVKEKLKTIGSETISMASPAEFPAFLRSELDRWGEVVRAAGLEKK